MTHPITVHIPHQLGRAEARRRIESGFAGISSQLPGGAAAHSERWEGDRLHFSVGGLGQTFTGFVDILDATVVVQVELPGLLGVIARSLKGRVQKAGQLLLAKK